MGHGEYLTLLEHVGTNRLMPERSRTHGTHARVHPDDLEAKTMREIATRSVINASPINFGAVHCLSCAANASSSFAYSGVAMFFLPRLRWSCASGARTTAL